MVDRLASIDWSESFFILYNDLLFISSLTHPLQWPTQCRGSFYIYYSTEYGHIKYISLTAFRFRSNSQRSDDEVILVLQWYIFFCLSSPFGLVKRFYTERVISSI